MQKVWFGGKEFSSTLQTNEKTKSLDVVMNSPEEKWNGTKSFPFPENEHYLCFYTQIQQCLKLWGTLRELKGKEDIFQFVLVWDIYPYYSEQYDGLDEEIFSKASIRYSGQRKNEIRFSLEVQGQILFYIYDENFNFKELSWVAQAMLVEKK